jgi:hypothetical protein
MTFGFVCDLSISQVKVGVYSCQCKVQKQKKSISYIYLIFVVFQIKVLKEEKRVNKCRYEFYILSLHYRCTRSCQQLSSFVYVNYVYKSKRKEKQNVVLLARVNKYHSVPGFELC